MTDLQHRAFKITNGMSGTMRVDSSEEIQPLGSYEATTVDGIDYAIHLTSKSPLGKSQRAFAMDIIEELLASEQKPKN